jgi:hypothetical protein
VVGGMARRVTPPPPHKRRTPPCGFTASLLCAMRHAYGLVQGLVGYIVASVLEVGADMRLPLHAMTG